jgi:hypothetical protein
MGMFEDVLAWMDNKRRVAGRNVSDLWNDPYNALQKTAYNTAQTVRELPDDPANFLGGGVGHIAYHGSPHKFDKFSLDKIGTGEGAQAYGHGLYLAESPGVATEYQKNLSQFSRIDGKPLVGNKTISSGARTYLLAENADLPKAIQNAKDAIARKPDNELLPPILKELESLNPDSITKSSAGNLYKTDIPDEAVARFLDWDKPLSQQSEQARRALFNADIKGGYVTGAMGERQYINPIHATKTGKQILDDLNRLYPGRGEEMLKAQGIPGIRYLDGGSRSAGQGSSNFVAFDPEMIRILERNGIPTGKVPWKQGEYDLGLRDTTWEPPLFPDTTR